MIEPILKVWCVCVGDKYPNSYVHRLQAMVAANLTIGYRFYCLTNRKIEGVDCVRPYHNWPGWWSKLELFDIETGPALYFDLDVVIVNNVDTLICREGISLPKNWAQSGYGGCQSSVMAWSGDYRFMATTFKPQFLTEPQNGNYGYYGTKKLWGDQEYITDLLGEPGGENIAAMNNIFSYKYHCKNGLPKGAKVVCFHGSPKPHEVNDEWIPF